jgi:probable rRNA maturation factor
LTAAVQVRNRQRTARVGGRFLGDIARSVLERVAAGRDGSLGIYLLRRAEIVRLNETFLRHAGPTDVIAFDYLEGSRGAKGQERLHGEIFICIEEAMKQARRFGASWPDEVVRCMIDGVLHLSGYDDTRSAKRRRMKRMENRLLKELKRSFPWQRTALVPAR